MNSTELIESMVNSLADAVWTKLEARINSKLSGQSVDDFNERVQKVVLEMDINDLIDRNDLVSDVADRVNQDVDLTDAVADEVSDYMRRADLKDYVDMTTLIDEVKEDLDIKGLVREEVKRLNFTVTVS
jgi:hypothetical protein